MGTLTMDLPVKLTADEMAVKGTQLGRALQEKADTEQEFDGVKQEFKAKLKDVGKRISEIGHVLAAGEEKRPVPVETVNDYESATVKTIRTDTSAVVDSRPMFEDELTRPLPFEATATPGAPEKGKLKRRRKAEASA